MSLKVYSIVGARPQFIKAAMVSRALRGAGVQEIIIHTGQHYDRDMSAAFFESLEIPEPDYNLGVGSGEHGAQIAHMLQGIERVLLDDRPRPDWVIVFGDTNSTHAGALAAAKLHLPLAHVEAGLRSFNPAMSEEINRIAADLYSDILFAPTPTAVRNLKREGIVESSIHLVGDVMYDAALHYGVMARQRSRIIETLSLEKGGFILATIHRAENADDPQRLLIIMQALERIAQEVAVVLPLHPRTRKSMEILPIEIPTVRCIDPVDYLDMQMLEQQARLIVTDSGGVQKEAYFHGVPCVTLRNETEWTELIEAGCNRLIPPENTEIVTCGILDALNTMTPNIMPKNLYGDGHASRRIVEVLQAH